MRRVIKFSFAPAAFGLLLALSPLPMAAAPSSAPAKPPVAPRKPVTDTYHGVQVVDDYRWMEDWSDPAVRKWSEGQNAFARAYLDKLPQMDAIRHRVDVLAKNSSAAYSSLEFENGVLFAVKDQPPLQQPFIVTLKSVDDLSSERTVLDPNKLDPSGHTSFDFYVPSHDARYIAVSLSRGGSESGDVHFYDVASGAELPDVLPRVNGGTAGGSVAWNADNSGVYYTRYPRAGERAAEDLDFYQQVYFHRLGTLMSADTYSIGKEFPRIAEIALSADRSGRHVLAHVENGDGGEVALYLVDASSGEWKQISTFGDRAVIGEFGEDNALYVLSRQGAPRGKILRLPLDNPSLAAATTVVPESEAGIEALKPAASRLYVTDIVGGPEQMRVFDLTGKALGLVPTPPVSSIGGTAGFGGDDVLVNVSSYTQPPAWYRYAAADGKITRTSMARTSPADFSDVEVVSEFATSRDGTRVPIHILRRKGMPLNGQNPTVLYAYGGYGLSETPTFRAGLKAWLEQGGVYAVANIRGGGEYGDQWHLDGNLLKKQNDYDDFAACSRWLLDNGYTSTSRLAIEGGSNGGLLMGVMTTQHPEYYRAVVSHVGIYDMLRVETQPNGAFNVTEYGTVKDPEQFKALYGYSPLQHVKDGTVYPSVMFLTGANDPRVDPSHSRKMTARMQAANGGPNPILLRTSSNAGHGIGSSLDERVSQQADVWGFLFHELGVKYKPVDEIVRPEKSSTSGGSAPGSPR